MTGGIAAAFALGGLGWTFASTPSPHWVMHGGKGRNESRASTSTTTPTRTSSPLWDKTMTEAVVVAALAGLGSWLAGPSLGLSFAAGFAVYHGYELLHRRIHSHPHRARRALPAPPPHGPPLHGATKNHGVSFPSGTWCSGPTGRRPRSSSCPRATPALGP